MKYDLITFDCYGTLIDWEGGMREVFGRILKERGLAADETGLAAKYIQYEMWAERAPYKPYRDVLAAASALLFRMECQVELTPDEQARLAASLPDWKPFSDARPALERLKKRCKIAILSNIDDDLLALSLGRLGVEFDETITAQQVGSYKPVTTHWREALRRFDLEPEQVLHVGGSYLHDVMPAKQIGLDCIWINRKNEPFKGAFPPDLTLPDLSGLAGMIGA